MFMITKINKIGMPHVCIHSGYKRAHKTAECIRDEICDMTGESLPLMENFSLREREPGITHVMLSDEVENFLNWNDKYWKCKGALFGRSIAGESLLQLRETRVRNFLWNYLKRFSAKTIIVVCHGRVMQALHMEILDMSILEMETYLKEPHPENCEIRHYGFNWRTHKLELLEII